MRTAKLALLVLTPLALLSACAGSPPDRPIEGAVESASVVSLSSQASNPRMAYRVRMPDGTTKDVVQSGERFDVGERVRITADGRLTQP